MPLNESPADSNFLHTIIGTKIQQNDLFKVLKKLIVKLEFHTQVDCQL